MSTELSDAEVGLAPHEMSDADVGLGPQELSDADVGLAHDLSKVGSSPYDRFKLQESGVMRTERPLESYSESVPKALNPDYDFTRATGGNPIAKILGGAADLAGQAVVKVADIPTRLHNIGKTPDSYGYQPTLEERSEGGKPIIRFPRSQGTGVVAGTENLLSSTAESMVGRPQSALVLPLTLGEGMLPKIASSVYGTTMAAQLPEEIQHAIEVVSDPKATTAQKTEAVGNPVVQAMFAKAMLGHATAEPKPAQGPLATGEVLKMPQGAKPLAPIGEFPAAKALEGVKTEPVAPVAASEAPKPPQTPPVEAKPAISQPEASKGAAARLSDLKKIPEAVITPEQATERDALQAKSDTVRQQMQGQVAQVKAAEIPTVEKVTEAEKEQMVISHEKLANQKADYQPAIKGASGKVYSNGQYHWEIYDNIHEQSPAELKGAKTGYIDKSGNFLSLLDVARAEMKNKAAQPSTAQPLQRPVAPNVVSSETPPPVKAESVKPKVSTEPPPEQSGKVPTVAKAAAKVEKQVKTVARTEGQRPAKEVKNELVSRLEAAIQSAPEDSPEITVAREKYAKAVKDNRATDSARSDLEKALGKHTTKVTIDIPGDGTFTVWNTKENLTDLLTRAKRIDTSATKSVGVKYSGTSKADKEWIEQQKANPPKESEIIGMGGAVPSEFTPGSGDAGRESYGIAERVRRERAAAGEVAEVPRGEGTTAPDSIEHGRDLLSAGADPEAALSNFEKTKRLSSDDMALVRARGEQLAQAARNIERKFGTGSPEFKVAWDALSAWDTRTKPMQTEWHKTGQAQQGETDIDTGTFTGLAQAFKSDTGKEFSPKQAKQAVNIAEGVTKATDAVDTAKDNLYTQLDKETGTVTKKPAKGTPPQEKVPPTTVNETRKAFTDYKAGTPLTPDQVKAMWQYAKDNYLDKGETDLDNIRQGIATDLGISKADVTRGLAQPKGAKRMSDEMYAKMSEQRRLQNAAKAWVKNQALPGWYRFIKGIPRVFFIDKIFGHGTVGMVTHAGLNIFNPPAWKTYWPNFLRQFKLLGVHEAKMFGGPGAGAYHEQMMQNLTRDPLFVKARRAGLANDPQRYTDDYNSAFSQWFHKLGLGGNRGFDALKIFRQARFNQIWNDLPASLQTPESATFIADGVNHATGVVKMRFREWANWTFFAPKLEGSRWAWMIGDPVKAAKTLADWKEATPEERQFALGQVKEKATIAGVYLSLLALNQGLLSASDSKQKINFTNPRRGDFLAFKAAGHDFGLISPMLGMVRLFANLYHAARGQRGKVEALTPRAEELGQEGESYLRGKLSPFMGFGMDLGFQADYAGRPLPFSNDKVPAYMRREGVKKYTYPEYTLEQFAPIPVEEAIREVWRHQGMSDAQINTYLKALATGVVMGTTGARMSEDTHPEK